MKDKNKKRPEDLDAMMDILDTAGLDDIEIRLPMIEGISYVKPRKWDEFFRDNGGENPVPVSR
jgi:hypothetical protein